MPKYVYLFELDSVRKTDAEIKIGQEALYNEIVCNGNVVVLTYNQFVDSRGFFSLLDNPEYYDSIIRLFENGAIRISQFAGNRTISQYLINACDYEKDFIYSGWPLKSTQKRLLALIKRSLMYSDLSEINTYITGVRSDEDIKELFQEVSAVNDRIELSDTSLSPEDCKEILQELYWLLKMVLTLSAMHFIYMPPKDNSEYKDYKFHNILDIVLKFQNHNSDRLWEEAVDIIKNLSCFGDDTRTKYVLEIHSTYASKHLYEKQSYQYAEAIIDLVYNYSCELSICNISRHYKVEELSEECEDKSTFESDFFARLSAYWDLGDLDHRFLAGETNAFDAFDKLDELPDFAKAVRITEYDKNEKIVEGDVPRYEYQIQEQRKVHTTSVVKSIGKKIAFSILCIAIACFMELFLQGMQDVVDDYVSIDVTVKNIVETLLFLFIAEELTSFFSSRFSGLLSLSEALGGIGQLVKDGFYMLVRKKSTYTNDNKKNLNQKERRSEGVIVECLKSDAIRKYERIRNTETYAPMFKESDTYPIADTKDTAVLKKISELEELYNYRFGIVYKSRYHIMCVDPIRDGEEKIFPYERIIPVAGNGVVMVTMHHNNFVLLKQYRHALRDTQIAFPRGFAEEGILSETNAKKELQEELNASISKSPILLGQVATDSGLTSSRVNVYLVEIDNYSQKDAYEGILEIIELDKNEFKQIIDTQAGVSPFDDGFTLAAYTLYKKYEEL